MSRHDGSSNLSGNRRGSAEASPHGRAGPSNPHRLRRDGTHRPSAYRARRRSHRR